MLSFIQLAAGELENQAQRVFRGGLINNRLEFWLISSNIQEDVDKVDIIPAIRSDHCEITLSINGVQNQAYGPPF